MKINEILQFDELDKPNIGSASFDSGLKAIWKDTRWEVRDGDAKEVQSFPFEIPLTIYESNYSIRIFGFLPNESLPSLMMEVGKFEDGYQVYNVRVEPSLRGKAIASKLYAMFVKAYRAPLYSGQQQTTASNNGIWKKLIQVYPNRVVGFDQKTKEDLPLNVTDKGPVVREKEPVYNTVKDPKVNYHRSRTKADRTRLLKLLP